VLTTSDVEQLLQQPKAKVVVKKRWLNIKLLLFMSMLSTLFVVLMWLPQPTPTPIAKQHTMQVAGKKAQHVVIESQEKPNTTTPKKGLPTSSSNVPTESTNQPTSTPTYFSFTPIASNTFPTPQQQPSEPERNYFNDRGELLLTYDELAKLGIVTDGSVLRYNCVVDTNTNIKLIRNAKDSAVGYPFFKLLVSETGGRHVAMHGVIEKIKLDSIPKFWAGAVTFSPNEKNDLYITEFINHSDNLEPQLFKEIQNYLIPVRVETTPAKQLKYAHENTILFWFKAEQAFINALPNAARKQLQTRVDTTDMSTYIKIVQSYSNLMQALTLRLGIGEERIKQLPNRIIELNKEGLSLLKIKTQKNVLMFKTIIVDDSTARYIKLKYNNGRKMLISNSVDFKEIKQTDTLLIPVAITTKNGDIKNYFYIKTASLSIRHRDEKNLKRFIQEFDDLIPIQTNPDILIWYRATPYLREIINKYRIKE
jgi:hypothetical protein